MAAHSKPMQNITPLTDRPLMTAHELTVLRLRSMGRASASEVKYLRSMIESAVRDLEGDALEDALATLKEALGS